MVALPDGLRRVVGRTRRPVLTLAAFGLLSAAAWQISLGWGLAAAGVACLVFEGLLES